jgi:hypothetical protein
LEKIDPFFNDIIAGLSDDEMAAEEEAQKKQLVPTKRTPPKMVFR